MNSLPDPLQHRTADHDIDDIFLKRWSPRAMNGEPVAQSDLNRLLEAARWAPSTYNEQEWRYLYAHRDTDHWETFFSLLMEANQAWCDQAGVLLVIASHKTFSRNGKPNGVHSFDAGASFENLALQGASMDLVIHPMAGFNRNKAQQELLIPEDFHVDAMVAIGHPGDLASLPEGYVEMDRAPSGRKPIQEISCEGRFQFEG
ncbi:MAG: nitroreductase family protein [Planctomycetaceae bacterium]|nr:nitroreductase family protein [Planctomycetaceae bacterium]